MSILTYFLIHKKDYIKCFKRFKFMLNINISKLFFILISTQIFNEENEGNDSTHEELNDFQ